MLHCFIIWKGRKDLFVPGIFEGRELKAMRKETVLDCEQNQAGPWTEPSGTVNRTMRDHDALGRCQQSLFKFCFIRLENALLYLNMASQCGRKKGKPDVLTSVRKWVKLARGSHSHEVSRTRGLVCPCGEGCCRRETAVPPTTPFPDSASSMRRSRHLDE